MLMIQRGLSYTDVAKMAGIDPRYVANVLAHNSNTWPPCSAINRAMGSKIFSKQKHTNNRKNRNYEKVKRTAQAS